MLGTGQRHQNKRVRCIPGTPEGCAWLLELLVCTQEKTYFIWFPTSWLFPFLCPGTLFGFPTISAALIYRGILGAPVGNTVFYGFLIGGSMHKPKPLKLYWKFQEFQDCAGLRGELVFLRGELVFLREIARGSGWIFVVFVGMASLKAGHTPFSNVFQPRR